VANDKLQAKLINYLQDTCALEREVLNMLDSAIANTDDQDLKELLRQHREETVHHGGRLQRRLDELGAARSPTAEITAVVGSWFKGFADTVRGDKAGKNLRDAFVTEHLEIASYELLEKLALRAGDDKTAGICRINVKDEYEMAKKLGQFWARAVDLTLLESGISLDAGRPSAATSTGSAATSSDVSTGASTGSYERRTDAAERGGTWSSTGDTSQRGGAVRGDSTTSGTGYDQSLGNVS
jgi:ferritin-like metal-binding protein YciE